MEVEEYALNIEIHIQILVYLQGGMYMVCTWQLPAVQRNKCTHPVQKSNA